MKFENLAIPEVILIKPDIFEDERGCFFETFNASNFEKIVGRSVNFVQDNQSISRKHVLRGMHYQITHPQAKLVRVSQGEVFDVAVDLRKDSATFGKWVGAILSGDNNNQLWIPEGFAHGFFVLSDVAVFQYKVSDYWNKEGDRCIRFDDKDLFIEWPTLQNHEPIVSEKDKQGLELVNADLF